MEGRGETSNLDQSSKFDRGGVLIGQIYLQSLSSFHHTDLNTALDCVIFFFIAIDPTREDVWKGQN